MVPPDIIAEAMKSWYAGANLKNHIGNAEINSQSHFRKRSVEQIMMVSKYVHCYKCIIYRLPADPPSNSIKDSTVDIEEINEAADDEEENREMEIVGFMACSPESVVRPWSAFGEKCAHPRSFS